MQFSKHPVLRWLPAVLMMLAIFIFSATPSRDPQFTVLQYAINKGGHVIGYAMLTLSFWRGFEFGKKYAWLAWLLALVYAATDEYHQSFVPGRHPAVFDVAVYDGLGALAAIWIASRLPKQKRPIHDGLVAESETLLAARNDR